MADKKTLTFALMDPPYENARSTTALRLIDIAARRGYDVNVFAYEGAVCLPFALQKAHPNAVHGRDADEEDHPLPREWVAAVIKAAEDAGGKVVHVAPDTTSTIISKSISKGGGRTSYRGLVKAYPGAKNAKSTVRCDALLLDAESRSDTYPVMEIDEEQVTIQHEATVSKVGDEQLFYLQSRGLTEEQAMGMIVNGFIEPVTRTLPMEYAVEWSRLIELQMEGSVG